MDNWSGDMLNFDFLEKRLGIVSALYIVHDFSRKIFLMLYSINPLTTNVPYHIETSQLIYIANFIAWLLLLVEILMNICIATVCEPGCDVIIFEVDFIFLIKPIFYIPKSLEKNLNILRTKRAFKVKQKAFFTIFKGPSVAKNFFRHESGPLRWTCCFTCW